MLTSSQFLSQYDEFQAWNPSQVEVAIAQAARFCPIDVWGTDRNLALGLVTAHILTMRDLQAAATVAAAVQSAKGKEGKNLMGSDNWFNGTTYGQQFLQLRSGIPVSGFTV
ncbi:hypothetical protein WA1_18890 [Scytonema hofmannii PCC 7110]|uniref:DUF4054 domain-containing protein n=2 Tax=Scytonema hofmannii TaxID=34078 RepID=A0A139XBJ2_9CYAN|nr:hypothetical protein WA1_18890 [Scytonema hofmannii PCC 7110]